MPLIVALGKLLRQSDCFINHEVDEHSYQIKAKLDRHLPIARLVKRLHASLLTSENCHT